MSLCIHLQVHASINKSIYPFTNPYIHLGGGGWYQKPVTIITREATNTR